MVPSATWNAFFSSFVPLPVLLLGVQLSRGELFKLLPWVLGHHAKRWTKRQLSLSSCGHGQWFSQWVVCQSQPSGCFACLSVGATCPAQVLDIQMIGGEENKDAQSRDSFTSCVIA
jgi:hypothetical protein